MSMVENKTFNYEESKKRYIDILNSHEHVKIQYFPYDEKEKNEFISLVENNLTPYNFLFDIIEDSNETKLLILKKKILSHPAVEVLPATKCFDVMAEVHLFEDHAYDLELETLKNVYHIPKALVTVFLQACNVCGSKSDRIFTKNSADKTIPEFSALCTVLQLSSEPDNRFSEFIVYVDAWTNYVLIRPTYSRNRHVIAYEMLKIFLDLGLPENIIVSQMDTFWNGVMEIVKSTNIFSHLPKVIQKKKINKLKQVSQNITFLTNLWMRTRNSPNWAIGLKEVQWQLNNLLDSKLDESRKLKNEIILTPYHAHFGFFPNHSVIQKISDLNTAPDPPEMIRINSIVLKDSFCCICGEKIYKIFYKTCGVCKKKCHFDCCAISVVESSSNIRYMAVRCHICGPVFAIS